MDLMLNQRKELEDAIGRLKSMRDNAEAERYEQQRQLNRTPSPYMEKVLKYQHEYWRGRAEGLEEARKDLQAIYNKLY
jgi:hypothetical protein